MLSAFIEISLPFTDVTFDSLTMRTTRAIASFSSVITAPGFERATRLPSSSYARSANTSLAYKIPHSSAALHISLPDRQRSIAPGAHSAIASQIAREIVRRREQEPIETTGQFVEIIKAGIPAAARRHGGHPAKKSFQAIRIEVNHELDVLERGLDAATRWLNPGGRICVISYHSLEDRIVKNHFKEMSQGCTCPPEIPVCVCGNVPILKVITRKPLVAQPDEVERNPRARSAKIRVAQRL